MSQNTIHTLSPYEVMIIKACKIDIGTYGKGNTNRIVKEIKPYFTQLPYKKIKQDVYTALKRIVRGQKWTALNPCLDKPHERDDSIGELIGIIRCSENMTRRKRHKNRKVIGR